MISVSLWSQDCSWYYTCDLHKLRSDIAGFLTARVPTTTTAAADPSQAPVAAASERVRIDAAAERSLARVGEKAPLAARRPRCRASERRSASYTASSKA